MDNKQIQNSLALMDKNFEIGDYNSVIKTCGTIFEIIFKQIIQEAMGNLPINDRDVLFEEEKKQGGGNKSFKEFTLGQIAGYFHGTKLLTKWAKHTKKDLGVLKSFDIESFRILRNDVQHNKLSTVPESTARLYHSYLINWLAFLGLQDITKSVKNSFDNSNRQETKEDSKPLLHKDIKSAYNSSLNSESKRLKVQSQNNLDFDLKIFKDVFSRIGKTEGITVLDFGCASGVVAYDRFKDLDIVTKVIGVDINKESIDTAKAQYQNDKFHFYHLDILSSDGLMEFMTILATEGITKFDFIYCAYVIHHLEKPKHALIKLRSLLSDNGVIFVKAEDDQRKICYPDETDLAKNIMDLQISMSTTSDRYFARKINDVYRASGYKNVKLYYDFRDTIGKSFEERLNLFIESFSYRKNYVKSALDKDPENKILLERYHWIQNAQEELMFKFAEEDFYYAYTVTVGIASKH